GRRVGQGRRGVADDLARRVDLEGLARVVEVADAVRNRDLLADLQIGIRAQPVRVGDDVPELRVAERRQCDGAQRVAGADDVIARGGARVLRGDGRVVVVKIRG